MTRPRSDGFRWQLKMMRKLLLATCFVTVLAAPALATPITLGFNITTLQFSGLAGAWTPGAFVSAYLVNGFNGVGVGGFSWMPFTVTLYPDLYGGGAPFAGIYWDTWSTYVNTAFALGPYWSDGIGSYTVSGDDSFLDVTHYPYIIAGFVDDTHPQRNVFYTDSATMLLLPDASDVPEPSTLGLIGIGLLGLGAMRRRQRSKAV
jgi:PEP-CTERM motif